LSDAIFYRPDKSIRYEHIDALFTGDADWDLIATHTRDMIQVVLSIQAGRVMPSMLLRKLGTHNRRSLLYRVSCWPTAASSRLTCGGRFEAVNDLIA
jgi:TnpA family transposase